jgi:hypothetical protein
MGRLKPGSTVQVDVLGVVERAAICALGDWVAGQGQNVTDIFITHGHGEHWFASLTFHDDVHALGW